MPTDKYQLVEYHLGRDLGERLHYWLDDIRISAPAVARLITRETGVSITAQTIRQWRSRLAG